MKKKINFTKFMSVALLFVATFMATSCSEDDNTEETYSTQTAENLIAKFTEAGILTEDGDLVDGTDLSYIAVDDKDDAIAVLEEIVAGSFDTSGDKVVLADGYSYVNIIESNTAGAYYNVTFSLNELDKFEIIFALEEFCNDDNFKW